MRRRLIHLSEYSPWTQSIRPIHGLIHALYVFSVIKKWYLSLKSNHKYKIYSEKRASEIRSQINSINLNACRNALTDYGKAIFTKIILEKDKL